MPTQPSPRNVQVRVPAKLNLHLGVGPTRADGYHELVTVFHAVDLYDEITVRSGTGVRIRVSGPNADGVPTGPGNLAWRAATLLAARAGVAADVLIEIHKQIPVAGGMAGGSADAAATMLACARLWQVADGGLVELAAQLGSDVAFPLAGGTALATGRGEHLTAVEVTGALHWVLAPAPYGISAGAAYAELDRLRAAGEAPAAIGPPDGLLAALRDGDVRAAAGLLGNDLQAAALSLQPSLAATLSAGRELGALGALVSGSGPTCAFLCADEPTAHAVAAALPDSGTCTAAWVAHGPARPELVQR